MRMSLLPLNHTLKVVRRGMCVTCPSPQYKQTFGGEVAKTGKRQENKVTVNVTNVPGTSKSISPTLTNTLAPRHVARKQWN